MTERAEYDDGPTEVVDIRVPFVGVKSALVRDWVRAALVPDAVKRLFEIGMGRTTFAVPTMAGNVVNVPASAGVQTKALQGIIAIGVPQQMGLVAEDGEMPGVIAVGEWELAEARGDAHDLRERAAHAMIGPVDQPEQGDALGRYVPPDGHTVTVVEDAEVSNDAKADEPPPAPDPDRNALAREFLARRRAARVGPHDGPRAGDHPNHLPTPIPRDT